MSTIEELRFELSSYEKQMNIMWKYWDDVLRSWKLLERHRIIAELQKKQIKEWNYD